MKFWIPVMSLSTLALALTPEMTNAMAFLIGAIFVGLVNLYMARTQRLVQLAAITKAIGPMVEQLGKIEPKVTEINAHVNSEKTRLEGESQAKSQLIDLLTTTIEEMKRTAALLAQAKATSDTSTAVAQAAIAGASTPGASPTKG